MGGRGSSSGLTFTIPNAPGGGGPTNALIDQLPETISEALGNKGTPFSVNNAMTKSNPFYSQAYSAYSENCQRCVVTYELRRRGYDVEAQPTYEGDKWPQVINVNGQRLGRWRGAFRHAKTESVGVAGNNSTAENKVLSNLRAKMHEYGNGARAVVNIKYRGRGFGHVFNVENRGGQVVFIDAQSGQQYNAASMQNLMHIVDTRSVGLTRTDNLRVSGRVTNFVWQNHSKRNK